MTSSVPWPLWRVPALLVVLDWVCNFLSSLRNLQAGSSRGDAGFDDETLVPLAVDYELVQGIQRDILKTMNGRLGINGPDGARVAKELAQESAQVADKRQDLSKKLERLKVASVELLEIGLA
ncbi:hypothetical protein NMY22_g18660 [Coprinellus aureogranulatus]|nr:hypothetical protein NMY22_g18660 [Coprinellus aureogranulatus]